MSYAAHAPAGGSSPAEITAASKSNFALSFFFLPKPRRQGITNFYALSRVIDDAVDEAPTPEQAKQQLQFWRGEIEACYASQPTHPVSQAMQATIREFGIPRRYLDLLIEGCEMDLTKTRYANFEELYQYCFRVAGVIGLTSMKIFGLDGELERRAAEELGIALQLTNILRDIAVDAGKGRIYLPQDELQRFGLDEVELLIDPGSRQRQDFLKFQAERAQQYFDGAFAKMKQLPHRPLLAAWIMGRVYHRILIRMRARGFTRLTPTLKVSKARKLAIAVAEYAKGVF